jgi:hypothetical protein
VCYKCREKGHFADSFPSVKMGSGTDDDRSDGACHWSDRYRPGQPHLKKRRQGRPLLQDQGSVQAWTRKYKEWCDQQEQEPNFLWMSSKGSHGQRLSKW